MRLQPQRAGGGGRVNASLLPPCRFVATAMDFAMMAAAERHGEFVADLSPERPMLGKAQMMGIGWRAAANQTRLVGDKPDVVSVTNPTWLGVG
jgi:hypothetical protein